MSSGGLSIGELFSGLVVITVVLILIAGSGYWIAAQHADIQQAATTDGEIDSATVDRQYGANTAFSSYQPDVSYNYTVDGTEYTSTQLTPAGASEPGYPVRSMAVDRAAEYDGSVTVYYDPDNPDTAYLEQRYSFGWYILYTAGWLVLGYIGIGGIIVALLERLVPPLRHETPLGSIASVGVGSSFWLAILLPIGHFWIVSDSPASVWSLGTTVVVGTLIAIDSWLRITGSGSTGD